VVEVCEAAVVVVVVVIRKDAAVSEFGAPQLATVNSATHRRVPYNFIGDWTLARSIRFPTL